MEGSEHRHHPQSTNARGESSNSTINTASSSQLVQKKRLYLHYKVIDLARERLLALPQMESVEEYTGSREITIKENVTLESYLRSYGCRDKNSIRSVRLYLHDGKVKAYETTYSPCGGVIGTIITQLYVWNQDLIIGTAATMIMGPNSAIANPWVRPARRPMSPLVHELDETMIIQVSHIQSLFDLHQKVTLYFSSQSTIQIVLSIKIFDPRVDNTIVLIAALYLRTSSTPLIPVGVISFGTADPNQNTVNYLERTVGVPPNNFIGVGRTNGNCNYPPCDTAGIATYQMNIPAAELFYGDPNGLPIGSANGFNLDLWKLQDVIRRGFNI